MQVLWEKTTNHQLPILGMAITQTDSVVSCKAISGLTKNQAKDL